jgi:hypothetical protein
MKRDAMRVDQIDRAILILRGHRVLLDSDLAALYGVEARALNQAVSRNAERFPADFMFRLTLAEGRSLNVRTTAPSAEASAIIGVSDLRSQPVISSGGRRYLPHAFTEQGVARLSSVLRSPCAAQVNIATNRASLHAVQRTSTPSERFSTDPFFVMLAECSHRRAGRVDDQSPSP